jgi:TetR/AcrR family transcriptional regulator, regulator of cefoperazone and chloramphenicol sensitivity
LQFSLSAEPGLAGRRRRSLIERLYSIQFVRTAVLESDLTTRARIRDTAMEVFGRDGVAATSLRAVARAADVSPGLVIHHFGSKVGLVRAVDEAGVQRINLALSEVSIDESPAVVIGQRAEMMAAFLRSQPALCDYLGRALSEGTEASAELFHRLFSFAARDTRLVDAGVLRADSDPFWRAMHQVILVVGPLLLRAPIERELGGDLLAEDNVKRWTRAATDLLQHGLYAEASSAASHDAHAG